MITPNRRSPTPASSTSNVNRIVCLRSGPLFSLKWLSRGHVPSLNIGACETRCRKLGLYSILGGWVEPYIERKYYRELIYHAFTSTLTMARAISDRMVKSFLDL